MPRICFSTMLWVVMCVCIDLGYAADRVVVFAPMPMESPELVIGQWKPLLSYLEQRLGMVFRIEYSKSNQEILDKFRSGKIDLAYLGPLPYVALKKVFPAAQPVVKFREANGEAAYTCAMIALAGNDRKLKFPRNLKIALTQPMSTCGYFAADGLLHMAGTHIESNKYRYLNAHDAVALAVVRGDYDLGVVKSAIGAKYAHLGVIRLAETAALPALGLIANSQRLSKETIESVRIALLEVDSNTRATWGDNVRHGAVSAEDIDYNPMRVLYKKKDIPTEGNF
ncbi:phosphonate transport system substrate-binding protein [Propionivibrio dicarboxylicus]|uniref:Phosphonate transport system substrate-binding protein n=2 Tax=Propionivibrio dicarboxylicus TaxID=83767 RepID=A0A1G8EXR1_9RHOO|nr:phosphonate transport system substrate-binding protein [Propionivibrio dicarboxylicus]